MYWVCNKTYQITTSEPCKNLKRLFYREESIIPDEDMEEKKAAARQLKHVFRKSDIELGQLIGM